MSIDRKSLVDSLELVTPAANPGSFVPEFQNIHFNGSVLFASDGVVSIYTDNPLADHSFSVRADTFLNLLRNISAEKISLNIKEESLAVRTRKIEGKFKICPAGKPTATDYEKGSFDIGNSELLEALHICRFGVCKEKTSGSISGVHVNGSKVYSTDRFKAYRFDLGISSALPPFTLPTKFIEIVLKRREDVEMYGLAENKFYVVLKGGSLIETAVYLDDFPPMEDHFSGLDTTDFLELNFETELKGVLEKHLKSLLDKTDFFDREIKFTMAGKTCSLFSKSKGEGDLADRIEEEIEMSEDRGSFEFIVNPTLLQEVLQHNKGKFLYHPENQLILIDAGRLQVLIQTKV
jgi:DNA polymerase III sliding clamp (beta) subunit (PCNA family)